MRSRTTLVRVRFGETDAAGIVFYPNIFSYFDIAAHELLRACGWALGRRMRSEAIAFPIVESGARFRAPLHHDEELQVSATVARLGTTSFRLEYRIERDGVLAAEGFEVRVCVRLVDDALQPVPLPSDLRAALAAEPG